MQGADVLSVDSVPCGNIAALRGIDKYLVKTGTVTTFSEAHNLRVTIIICCSFTQNWCQ